MNEDYFVKIDNPNALRVNTLAASKNSLESLKVNIDLKQVIKKKSELKEKLLFSFQELVQTLDELNALLPHQEVLAELKKKEAAAKRSKKEKVVKKKASVKKEVSSEKKSSVKKSTVHVKKKPVKKKLTELDKLNSALEEIEKRLSSLN